MFGRRRYTLSREAVAQREAETQGREQQRREAAEKADREYHELCDRINAGNALSARVDRALVGVLSGTPDLKEIRSILATDTSGNPYAAAYLPALTNACVLAGFDPSAGAAE